jgi:hypothetical protein
MRYLYESASDLLEFTTRRLKNVSRERPPIRANYDGPFCTCPFRPRPNGFKSDGFLRDRPFVHPAFYTWMIPKLPRF